MKNKKATFYLSSHIANTYLTIVFCSRNVYAKRRRNLLIHKLEFGTKSKSTYLRIDVSVLFYFISNFIQISSSLSKIIHSVKSLFLVSSVALENDTDRVGGCECSPTMLSTQPCRCRFLIFVYQHIIGATILFQ